MLKENSIDKRIIEALQEDGRQSSNVLAKQLGVSSATVRRRIKNMVKSGLLRVTALVDPDKAGLPFIAIIALDIVNDKLDAALKVISKRPEVVWVCATTGRFDIFMVAHFPSSEDMSDFLRRELAELEGLKDSETFLCLGVEKGRYQYL